MLSLHLSEFPPGHGMLLADAPKQCLILNRAKCCFIGYPWSCGSLALFGVIFQWYNLMIRTYLGSWKFEKMMGDLSIQKLYLNFSKINPKSTQQGYPPWSALALIRVWPWIKLALFGVISQWYNLMIRTYLDSWKKSKMMDDLSIQNLYLNFSKINPKSTHQGYLPWSAIALIRVWPWIKLDSFGLIFQWYKSMAWILNPTYHQPILFDQKLIRTGQNLNVNHHLNSLVLIQTHFHHHHQMARCQDQTEFLAVCKGDAESPSCCLVVHTLWSTPWGSTFSWIQTQLVLQSDASCPGGRLQNTDLPCLDLCIILWRLQLHLWSSSDPSSAAGLYIGLHSIFADFAHVALADQTYIPDFCIPSLVIHLLHHHWSASLILHPHDLHLHCIDEVPPSWMLFPLVNETIKCFADLEPNV